MAIPPATRWASSPAGRWSTARAIIIRRTSCRAWCRSISRIHTLMPAAVWYNPATGDLGARRHGLWSVWRGGDGWHGVQSRDGRLGARRRCLRALWRRRRLVGYYNPSTGTYAHGSAAWGPNGGTANASFYNPRYGVVGQHDTECQCLFALGIEHDQRTAPDREHRQRQQRAGLGGRVQFQHRGCRRRASIRATGNNAAVATHRQRQRLCRRRRQCLQAHRQRLVEVEQRSWQPAQRPAGQRSQQISTAVPDARSRKAGSRQTLNCGNYQQLEQDRFARSQGGSEGRQFSAPEGRSFGGGGGRFRR